MPSEKSLKRAREMHASDLHPEPCLLCHHQATIIDAAVAEEQTRLAIEYADKTIALVRKAIADETEACAQVDPKSVECDCGAAVGSAFCIGQSGIPCVIHDTRWRKAILARAEPSEKGGRDGS